MSFGTQMATVRKLRGELDPADFTFVAEYYLGSNEEIADAYGCEEYPADGPCHEDLGRCDHCGTDHTYGALYRQTDGSYLAVGRDCAGKFFDFSSRSAYYKSIADRKTAEKAKKAKNNEAACRFLATRIDLQAAFSSCEHRIVNDIHGKLFDFGSISDKQANLVMKIAIEEAEKTPEPTPEPIPAELTDGRHEFAGEVLALKWRDSQFGGSLKMLFRDDRGFKLWGSAFNGEYDKGSRVSFFARVEVSKDDKCFGFFSRPTKGKVIK